MKIVEPWNSEKSENISFLWLINEIMKMSYFSLYGMDTNVFLASLMVWFIKIWKYEWASRNGLAGLFVQRTNVLNPFFWQMLSEIRKFKQHVVEYARQILLYFQLIYFHVSIHAACSVLFLYSKCISFKFFWLALYFVNSASNIWY